MNDAAPRLLFVPVSGAFGMGEYSRSLAIAMGAKSRWPGASVHFVLSRAAPYASTAPFPATLLGSSATFHSRAVIELMESWRPDVVLFDNAGRTAQLRAARRLGARVVYLSARRKQRRKAFRIRWMHLIDEHWIAYPAFIAGQLSWLERLKLQGIGRPVVRYLDVILARRAEAGTDAGAPTAPPGGFDDTGYALLVPGGGTGHPGANDAVDIFERAARELAIGGVNAVCVGHGHAATQPRLRLEAPMPQADLGDLMRGARVVVTNGGSTLLQAIACARPCLAVPIAGDQAERIRHCVDAGVAVPLPLDANAIAAGTRELWDDQARRRSVSCRAAELGLADGIDVAVRALAGLLRG